MPDAIDRAFNDLEYYPGSKTPKATTPGKAQRSSKTVDGPAWDAHPRHLVVGDKTVEFFGAEALALALNRRTSTIRKWEQRGKIPKARFRDQHNRRLYTRRMVERMIEIAQEEGVLDFEVRPDVLPPTFTDKVVQLWQEAV